MANCTSYHISYTATLPFQLRIYKTNAAGTPQVQCPTTPEAGHPQFHPSILSPPHPTRHRWETLPRQIPRQYTTGSVCPIPSRVQIGEGFWESSTACERLGRSRQVSRHCGIYSFSCRVGADIDLPMIAVIGSQSAGKSSLIESISGITLTRAVGTCTR